MFTRTLSGINGEGRGRRQETSSFCKNTSFSTFITKEKKYLYNPSVSRASRSPPLSKSLLIQPPKPRQSLFAPLSAARALSQQEKPRKRPREPPMALRKAVLSWNKVISPNLFHFFFKKKSLIRNHT